MTKQEWVLKFSDSLYGNMKFINMTPAQLAKKTGLSKSTIGRYLNGQREPSCVAVLKLANALDLNVEELIDFGEPIE